MRNWAKKLGVAAASVAALTTLISAVPFKANADTSRVVWFTIQNNNACASAYRSAVFYFNLNNISSTDANVTLHLYDNSGNEITYPGLTTSTWYLPSNITPGTDTSISGKHSLNYVVAFGGDSTANPCSAQPAYGKIVVNSEDAYLNNTFMANGEIRSSFVEDPYQQITNTPIVINNGQPF